MCFLLTRVRPGVSVSVTVFFAVAGAAWADIFVSLPLVRPRLDLDLFFCCRGCGPELLFLFRRHCVFAAAGAAWGCCSCFAAAGAAFALGLLFPFRCRGCDLWLLQICFLLPRVQPGVAVSVSLGCCFCFAAAGFGVAAALSLPRPRVWPALLFLFLRRWGGPSASGLLFCFAAAGVAFAYFGFVFCCRGCGRGLLFLFRCC